MKRSIIGSLILVGISITACTRQNSGNPPDGNPPIEKVSTTENQTARDMKTFISIVEIPTADFNRAMKFYGKILDINIEVVEMEGIKMGLFPNAGDGVAVQIIHGGDYKPSTDGAVVYLNGGDDLQQVADKIAASGGKILIPKTEIGPDMGFYAVFTDSEGNKLGLHSLH